MKSRNGTGIDWKDGICDPPTPSPPHSRPITFSQEPELSPPYPWQKNQALKIHFWVCNMSVVCDCAMHMYKPAFFDF